MTTSAATRIIPKPIITGFFMLGVLSSVAFSAIILFRNFICAWCGRFGVSVCSATCPFFSIAIAFPAPQANHLADIHHGKREAALYLLNSIRKSSEDWSYLAIFILSALAMALDLLLPGKNRAVVHIIMVDLHTVGRQFLPRKFYE